MSFEKRMRLIQAVLCKLRRQPMRWTPLLKAVIHECGSPPTLHYALKYLQSNGYVEHKTIGNKPHWAITEKGERLLEAVGMIKPAIDAGTCHKKR